MTESTQRHAPEVFQGIYPESWLRTWTWRSHAVAYVETPETMEGSTDTQSSTAVLIHGFGANKEHWRHNVATLSKKHRVVAIDLIGFGESDKPRSRLNGEDDLTGWTYSIDSWGQQVVDLIQAKIKGSVQLIGNSIGGVVALSAARILEKQGKSARQVILIDCAQRALDDKRLADQPPLRRWARPALKEVVRQRWVTRSLFKLVANAGVIEKVLKQAYPTGQNIDSQLIELLLQPALQTNADEAFRGFINLFDDRLAPDLLAQMTTPVAILCGELDPWEQLHEAEKWQQHASVKYFEVLKGLGHCPHDESPETVNPRLLSLLNKADLQQC